MNDDVNDDGNGGGDAGGVGDGKVGDRDNDGFTSGSIHPKTLTLWQETRRV